MATKKTPAKKSPAKKAPAKKRAAKSQPQAAGPAATVDLSKLKTKRALSVPMMKLNEGDQYAIKIQGVSQQMMPGTKSKLPATILRATDLTTGEIADFIAPTVLKSTLTRAYGENDAPEDHIGPIPDSPWEGYAILIEASKREGKRYMDVRVSELDA